MKAAIVYHRIDFDGLMSMCILKKYVIDKGYKVTLFPYNHNDETPKGLEQFDVIYVADICLPIETMLTLARETRLVWIDHHETSINEANEKGFGFIPGLRRIGTGACELCYKYTHPQESVPPVVGYLSAYDVFDKNRYDWENEVLPFQWGMRNRFGLDGDKLYEAYRKMNITCSTVIKEGKTVLNYVTTTGKKSAESYGFLVTVNKEHKGLAVLTDSFGSIARIEAAKAAGASIIINANRSGDGKYKVSLFAVDGEAPLHLGKYLKEKYQGGGHRNAAGATISEADFIRLISEKII